MNSDFRKVALIAGALGLLVSLYFALSPGGDDEAAPATTTAATATAPVRITIDTAEGGIYRGSVKQGREVVITVRSPVADEAHLHAYDVMADVAPGRPGRIEFTASILGQFELELEERHQLIGVLEVRP